MADSVLLSNIANPKLPEIMTPAQGVELQSMALHLQNQKLQQAQTLAMIGKQQQIQARLSRPDSVGPDGLPTAATLKDISAIDTGVGLDMMGKVEHFRDQKIMMQRAADQDRLVQMQIGEKVRGVGQDLSEEVISRVDRELPKDASPAKKDEAARKFWLEGIENRRGSGTYSSFMQDDLDPSGKAPSWAGLRSAPVNYSMLKAKTQSPKEVQQEKLGAEKQEFNIEKFNAAQEQARVRNEQALEKLRIEQERLELARQKAAKQAEGETGRAAVFTNRMITSANEAMRGLENVVKLPATTTRGIFGGRTQEGGLLSATKESLANKVTSEDAQLYNVMTAGIQRNLASIEAVGLMPSGALTHMMDNVIIKEGDTQLTKASKLAEIRQILEAGLEPILSNPKVPEQLKTLVTDIQKRVVKAVPFTQEDVISLMGSNDPEKTLGSIVQGQRKDKDSGAIIKPYGDADKERRYQEWKKSHGY